MGRLGLYITHPEVVIDPAIAPPMWKLNEKGLARAKTFAERTVWPDRFQVFSSLETKAMDLAQIISVQTRAPVHHVHEMGENDRAATGYLPPEKFEQFADAFFASPEQGPNGWESAMAAQQRIVHAVHAASREFSAAQFLVFCGHGAVGTLLKCFLGRRKIARDEDQRVVAYPGGGNCFMFDLDQFGAEDGRALLSEWAAMEDFDLGGFLESADQTSQ